MTFSIVHYSTWPWWFPILFSCVIFLGLEILSIIVPLLFGHSEKIPVKGKHLDELSQLDNIFVGINKVLTVIFVYHVIYVVNHTDSIVWELSEATVFNTLGSLIGFYLFYDLWYMLFHRLLHVRALYPIIHKHHHRQKAPSRGNIDAINVHPFEFLVGEYLHLITIFLIPCHIIAVVVFILAGGIFASLNHTRFDFNLPFGIYSVKVHDVHHRLPESNYAQYTMVWDRIFGSYRSYDATTNFRDDKEE